MNMTYITSIILYRKGYDDTGRLFDPCIGENDLNLRCIIKKGMIQLEALKLVLWNIVNWAMFHEKRGLKIVQKILKIGLNMNVYRVRISKERENRKSEALALFRVVDWGCEMWQDRNEESQNSLSTNSIKNSALRSVILFLAIIFFSTNLASTFSSEPIQIELLADAIYRAEGGAKASHPYGILAHYKTTTPRQACINTIKSGLKRYETSQKDTDFISFLAKTYCPIGAKNDPTGLNKNWVKNVSFFYARFSTNSHGALNSFTKCKLHNVKKGG